VATTETIKNHASRLNAFLGLQRSTKKPFVVATFFFFSLFPLLLLFSQTISWLVVAFILRGLKEFGEPTRKALIMDLSPDSCEVVESTRLP
jgi:hypothetical protein